MLDSEFTLFLLFLIQFFGWIIAIAGFGSAVIRFFPRPYQTIPYLAWNQGLFGLIFIGSLAIVINFFIPVYPVISILFFIFGILLYIPELRKKKVSFRKTAIYGVIVFILGINLIYYGAPVTDTGLYHIAMIRWIIENATPFGLANLHIRFGFNTIWFPLSAVIDQGSILFNRPVFFLNSILLVFYSTLVVDSLRSFANGPCDPRSFFQTVLSALRNISISQWFILLSLLPAVLISIRLKNFLFSPSPDYPVFLLTLIFFAFFIEYIEKQVTYSDIRTFLLIILVLFICTIKLSAIVLVPMVLIAILLQNILIILKQRKDSQFLSPVGRLMAEMRSTPGICIAMIIFLILPYAIRGTILSGNPLFPASIGSYIQLPWSVPVETTIGTSNQITAWARLPGENYMSSLGNFSWFHEWMINFVHSLFPLIAGVIGAGFIAGCLIVYAIRYGLIRRDRPYLLPVWYPLLTVLIGLAFWFCMYPDFRFALGYFSVLPIILIASPLLIVKKPYPPVVVLCMTVITIGVFFISGVLCLTDQAGQIAERSDRIPVFPDVQYVVKQTHAGENVYVPQKGDQVWNMPLPNTPNFNPAMTIIRDPDTQAFLMFLPPSRAL